MKDVALFALILVSMRFFMILSSRPNLIFNLDIGVFFFLHFFLEILGKILEVQVKREIKTYLEKVKSQKNKRNARNRSGKRGQPSRTDFRDEVSKAFKSQHSPQRDLCAWLHWQTLWFLVKENNFDISYGFGYALWLTSSLLPKYLKFETCRDNSLAELIVSRVLLPYSKKSLGWTNLGWLKGQQGYHFNEDKVNLSEFEETFGQQVQLHNVSHRMKPSVNPEDLLTLNDNTKYRNN